MVARNPDVILCFYMAESGSAREQILRRSGWAHVTAVRKGRVYDGFDNDVILRPGPRVLRGIAELRACLRPSSDR